MENRGRVQFRSLGEQVGTVAVAEVREDSDLGLVHGNRVEKSVDF